MSKNKPIMKSASDCNLVNLKETTFHKKKWKKGNHSRIALKKASTSKLSNVIERALTQDTEDHDTKDTSICSDDGFASNMSMVHLTIYLVIGNVAQSHSFLISNMTMVNNIITRAIDEFNTQFASEQTLFRLNVNPSLYALKPSKKNGYPKTDMPFVNSNGNISEINMTQFTLVWKEDAADFRSYFVKTVKEKKTCQGCVVF